MTTILVIMHYTLVIPVCQEENKNSLQQIKSDEKNAGCILCMRIINNGALEAQAALWYHKTSIGICKYRGA